jgi:hypothetical protein
MLVESAPESCCISQIADIAEVVGDQEIAADNTQP